jgi:hypothetical protein
MSSTKGVILTNGDSWESFLFIIRMMASAGRRDVWSFINPNLKDEPELPKYPVLPRPADASPTLQPGTTIANLTPEQRKVYKLLYALYKDDYAIVSLQLEAIEKILEYILTHISLDNIRIIMDKTTVYQILVALKQHLAPTDRAREFQISQE